jgi:acyl-CoA dehydrogenase
MERMRADGEKESVYVINGRKWWASGAMDTRCGLAFVVCRVKGLEKNERHQQHAIVVVPMNTPGIEVTRPMCVFGYDDAPHGHAEVLLRDVTVPCENIILGEGRGMEVRTQHRSQHSLRHVYA